MAKAVVMKLSELWELDHLYSKAGAILDEARGRVKVYDHDLTVRRSQEAFELYLKSCFRYLQKEYPASHELRKQIYELTEALKQCQIDRRQIARLVLANSVLDLWRSPAFYGDERLNVGGLFNDGEAKLALSYAESAQFVCSMVRSYVYRVARTD